MSSYTPSPAKGSYKKEYRASSSNASHLSVHQPYDSGSSPNVSGAYEYSGQSASQSASRDSSVLKPFVKKARKLVSGDKYRMRVDGFDLDLGYIIERRLIAMGIPGDKVDKVWRNNASEVADFFRRFHAAQFLIYNLSGLTYDYSKFENRVVECGWPDHHATSMELIHGIVLSIYGFLARDEKNCAAVHCLAGRSRTGMIIACYLLYAGIASDPVDTVNYFAKRRSLNRQDLTGPSQLRFINYYYRFLHRDLPPTFVSLRRPQIVRLVRLDMTPVPMFKSRHACSPIVKISKLSTPEHCVYRSPPKGHAAREYRCSEGAVSMRFDRCHAIVAGDIQVQVFHRAKSSAAFAKLISAGGFTSARDGVSAKYPYVLMFRFSFHTDFHTMPNAQGQYVIELKKRELDPLFAGPLLSDRFPPDFTVRLFFELLPRDHPDIQRSSNSAFMNADPSKPTVPCIASLRYVSSRQHTHLPPIMRTPLRANPAFLCYTGGHYASVASHSSAAVASPYARPASAATQRTHAPIAESSSALRPQSLDPSRDLLTSSSSSHVPPVSAAPILHPTIYIESAQHSNVGQHQSTYVGQQSARVGQQSTYVEQQSTYVEQPRQQATYVEQQSTYVEQPKQQQQILLQPSASIVMPQAPVSNYEHLGHRRRLSQNVEHVGAAADRQQRRLSTPPPQMATYAEVPASSPSGVRRPTQVMAQRTSRNQQQQQPSAADLMHQALFFR
jgi:protein-tyrosine phosphatase